MEGVYHCEIAFFLCICMSVWISPKLLWSNSKTIWLSKKYIKTIWHYIIIHDTKKEVHEYLYNQFVVFPQYYHYKGYFYVKTQKQNYI